MIKNQNFWLIKFEKKVLKFEIQKKEPTLIAWKAVFLTVWTGDLVGFAKSKWIYKKILNNLIIIKLIIISCIFIQISHMCCMTQWSKFY